MQINSNLFGRPVEVRHLGTDKTEIMIFQGMFYNKFADITFAVCMTHEGKIESFPTSRVRFIDCEKETTDILRCSLVPVPGEMFEDVGLIGRDDICDDQYRPVKIVNRGWNLIGYAFEGEPKYEYYVVDDHGNTYSLGHLYWKGDKE